MNAVVASLTSASCVFFFRTALGCDECIHRLTAHRAAAYGDVRSSMVVVWASLDVSEHFIVRLLTLASPRPGRRGVRRVSARIDQNWFPGPSGPKSMGRPLMRAPLKTGREIATLASRSSSLHDTDTLNVTRHERARHCHVNENSVGPILPNVTIPLSGSCWTSVRLWSRRVAAWGRQTLSRPPGIPRSAEHSWTAADPCTCCNRASARNRRLRR